eukprot:1314935-Rhodomonas_salina.1
MQGNSSRARGNNSSGSSCQSAGTNPGRTHKRRGTTRTSVNRYSSNDARRQQQQERAGQSAGANAGQQQQERGGQQQQERACQNAGTNPGQQQQERAGQSAGTTPRYRPPCSTDPAGESTVRTRQAPGRNAEPGP